MPPITPPCRVERHAANDKVVFCIIDANADDIVITPYEMHWSTRAIETAEQRANAVCAALNAYLTTDQIEAKAEAKTPPQP